jgi:hypothetical protein
MGKTKSRPSSSKQLVPKNNRGVLPPRAGFRVDRSSRLKNGGCKNR